jgi:hypothetical protein
LRSVLTVSSGSASGGRKLEKIWSRMKNVLSSKLRERSRTYELLEVSSLQPKS